jgi:nanoRNase/pAp phosphatase (c-di-AMP/oligoRNAs hydrolase)
MRGSDVHVADGEGEVAGERYRLVPRSDFDGLVCAVLLRQLDLVDEIVFVHPKDVQDGRVAIGPGDITTNLPYSPEAHLVFDHHHSEILRNAGIADNHVIDPDAPSAARVVYDHYGGADAFPGVSTELMRAVDQADSARYSPEEVLRPTGWVLLNSLMRCTSVRGSVAVVDLRPESVIHAGNRFVVYALYPQCLVSIHVLWGKQRQNTVIAVGNSILNRASTADIGALMLCHGGGHANAGTCQVPHDDADRVVAELVGHLNATNPAPV